jgi:hypothetical protein
LAAVCRRSPPPSTSAAAAAAPPSLLAAAAREMVFLTKRTSFSKDALGAERCTLEPCEGWVKKLSHKGVWQSRYFALINGFLNYYEGPKKAKMLASINLANVRPFFGLVQWERAYGCVSCSSYRSLYSVY